MIRQILVLLIPLTLSAQVYNPPNLTSKAGIVAFGDSNACGYGDYAYTADPANTTILGPLGGFVSQTAVSRNGDSLNFCHTGDQVADMVFNKVIGQNVPSFNPQRPSVIAIGTNDANNCGATTGCENNFQYALQASIGWLGVPAANKLFAQACGSNVNWTADTSTITGLPNAFVYSNVANATTSCTATTGNWLQWGWFGGNGATGTASLLVDGVVIDTQSSTGFNGQSVTTANGTVSTIFMQTYAVTPGVHTLTVTHSPTGAGTLYFEWGWFGFPDIPVTNPDGVAVANPLVVVSGIIKQYQDTKSTTTAAYDTIVQNVVTAMAANGVKVVYANPRAYINASSSSEMNCGASNAGLHVCRPGAAKWAYSILKVLP